MNRSKLTRGLLLMSLMALTACTGVNPKIYEGSQPPLVLEHYFLGQTRAWGMFQDRSGELKRSFEVDINGRMVNGELVMTEDFVYNDGEKSQRIWRIKRLDANHYEGRADDVIGVAKGVVHGRALNWTYTLALPVGKQTYHVQFDDWMYLQPDGVLLNRARMSKFGIELGQVTLSFQKKP
jgi:hypothetical protein